MSLLLLLDLHVLECRPARVDHRALAAAIALVQILPALWAQPLAGFVADRRGRDGEQDLLAQRAREVDDLPAVRLLVDGLGIERGPRLAGAGGLCPTSRLSAHGLAGNEGEGQVDRLVYPHLLQAALALPLERD